MFGRVMGAGLLSALWIVGCSSARYQINDGSNVKAFVTQSPAGAATDADPAGYRFKQGLCEAQELKPEGRQLTEADLLEFFAKQQLDVRIERPRSDLVYLIVSGAGTDVPVRLRVAVLKSADEAGSELHTALLQHGPGAWGVRRSNLAVLGPIGTLEDDLTFAGKTRLACWGMFMTAGRDDTYAVPGAYREL